MYNLEGYRVMIVNTYTEDDFKVGIVDKDYTDIVYVTLDGKTETKQFKKSQIQIKELG